MTIIFAAIAIVCVIEWLKSAISLRALILYIIFKGYPLPTKEETEMYCKKAVRLLFKQKLK